MQEVVWCRDSREELKKFPREVQVDIGTALMGAQQNKVHPSIGQRKEFGNGVYQISNDCDTNTYRCVYYAKIKNAIYVLHSFKKKSKSGIATPPRDMNLVKRRLKDLLAELAKEEKKSKTKATKKKAQKKTKAEEKMKLTKSTGNVFEDLGFKDPTVEALKAETVLRVFEIIKKKKMTQTEIGKVLGIKQPDVSRLMSGKVSRFSFDKILAFVASLGKQITIKIT